MLKKRIKPTLDIGCQFIFFGLYFSLCFSLIYLIRLLGTSTGLVSAWDTATNTCFLHWKADSAEITYMKACGDRLLVAGASRGIRLWSLVGTKDARCYGNTINFVMEDELSLNAPVSIFLFLILVGNCLLIANCQVRYMVLSLTSWFYWYC